MLGYTATYVYLIDGTWVISLSLSVFYFEMEHRPSTRTFPAIPIFSVGCSQLPLSADCVENEIPCVMFILTYYIQIFWSNNSNFIKRMLPCIRLSGTTNVTQLLTSNILALPIDPRDVEVCCLQNRLHCFQLRHKYPLIPTLRCVALGTQINFKKNPRLEGDSNTRSLGWQVSRLASVLLQNQQRRWMSWTQTDTRPTSNNLLKHCFDIPFQWCHSNRQSQATRD